VVTETPARAATSASVALCFFTRLSCMMAALPAPLVAVTELRPTV
jgi:hypothetical protein